MKQGIGSLVQLGQKETEEQNENQIFSFSDTLAKGYHSLGIKKK